LMSNQFARIAATGSSLFFAGLGLALLFAPEEAGGALGLGAGGPIVPQLLASALLGFAAANWTARGSALGGIYGRAVVVANHVHFTVGAILLVKHGLESAVSHPGYWTVAGLYVLGAAAFVYLAF